MDDLVQLAKDNSRRSNQMRVEEIEDENTNVESTLQTLQQDVGIQQELNISISQKK